MKEYTAWAHGASARRGGLAGGCSLAGQRRGPELAPAAATKAPPAARGYAPGPPPLTMLPAVSPPSMTITEPVK